MSSATIDRRLAPSRAPQLGARCYPTDPMCQQTLIAIFNRTAAPCDGVEALLAHPDVRKFIDWIANETPDFTATGS